MNYYYNVIKDNKELSKCIKHNDLSAYEVQMLFNNPFFELVDFVSLNGKKTTNKEPKLKKREIHYDFTEDSIPLDPDLTKKLLKSIQPFVFLHNSNKLSKAQKDKYQMDNSIKNIDFLFKNAKYKVLAKERIDIKIEDNEQIINNIYAVLKEIEKTGSSGKLYLSVLYYSYFDLERKWTITDIAKKMSYSCSSIKKSKKKAIDLFCTSYNYLRKLNYDKYTKNYASLPKEA